MSSDHARDAARDLALTDRLSRLLRDVADRTLEIDVDAISEEDWVQDHLVISDVEPGRIWFEGGVGPIVVPHQASDLARPGCSAFVTAARTAGSWQLLQVDFVYPLIAHSLASELLREVLADLLVDRAVPGLAALFVPQRERCDRGRRPCWVIAPCES